MITLTFKFEVLRQKFYDEEKKGWRIHTTSVDCNGNICGGPSYPILASEVELHGIDKVLQIYFPGHIFFELREEIKKEIKKT